MDEPGAHKLAGEAELDTSCRRLFDHMEIGDEVRLSYGKGVTHIKAVEEKLVSEVAARPSMQNEFVD